ncbi:hypothetical protein HYS48_05180 [Candidatus Woesearchaeota archaeon]|nr:hypothetical protein [Candidatus Woesearchaeota archaeon]
MPKPLAKQDYKEAFFGFLSLVVIVLLGYGIYQFVQSTDGAGEKACEAPLVKIGNRCCMDADGDGFCDPERKEAEKAAEQEIAIGEEEPIPEEEPIRREEKRVAAEEEEPGEQGPVCGNDACEAGEDTYSCSEDCETRKQYVAILGKITKSRSTAAQYIKTENRIYAYLKAKETLYELCRPLDSCSAYLLFDGRDKEELKILVGDRDAMFVHTCTYRECLEDMHPGLHNVTLVIEDEPFIAKGTKEMDMGFLGRV